MNANDVEVHPPLGHPISMRGEHIVVDNVATPTNFPQACHELKKEGTPAPGHHALDIFQDENLGQRARNEAEATLHELSPWHIGTFPEASLRVILARESSNVEVQVRGEIRWTRQNVKEEGANIMVLVKKSPANRQDFRRENMSEKQPKHKERESASASIPEKSVPNVSRCVGDVATEERKNWRSEVCTLESPRGGGGLTGR